MKMTEEQYILIVSHGRLSSSLAVLNTITTDLLPEEVRSDYILGLQKLHEVSDKLFELMEISDEATIE